MSQQLLNKDPVRTHLEAARVLIAEGQLREAALKLNEAQRVSPNDARVFMLAGLMAEKSGNAKAALDNLRKMNALAPDWNPGLLELALFLARNNQFPEALRWAEKLSAREGNNPHVISGIVDIAHRAGDLETAIRYIQNGLRAIPGNIPLSLLLARDLRSLGRFDESAAVLQGLIDALPEQVQAHYEMVLTQIAAGRAAQAQASSALLVKLQPENKLFAYYHAITQGETPAQQPAELYVSLFDSLAEGYDLNMFQQLGYRLPKIVAEKIKARFPDNKFNVLDLGCGTGLLGVFLGRIDGYLIGVDQSIKMIEQAERHHVYDQFHTVNLHDALRETPASIYEVISALDVFIYSGNLETAIADALRVLKPAGEFIFSCEKAPEDGANWVLNTQGRYAHKLSYIQAMCQQAGYAEVAVEELVLRTEGGTPVEGFLVTARKAAA